ncbi:MAG: N-6 DNA methylase [Pyrinomonadaceae bacterium]
MDVIEAAAPDLMEFYLQHGRLPHITDEIKPWDYRGWLLPYVIQLHGSPFFGKGRTPEHTEPAAITKGKPTRDWAAYARGQCPDRWGYYLRTLEAGQLLEESIPRLDFRGEFDSASAGGRKAIEQAELVIERGHDSWSSFHTLVDWLYWACGLTKEEPKVDDQLNEDLYRTFNVEPLLLDPSDHLGSYLAERKGTGWNPTAFFPTPHHVVEMMVRMQMQHDGRDARALTVVDPCVGTGRMLLHASNYSLRLYGQDIDGLVVKITRLNGVLYAPWLAFGMPEGFFGETNQNDTKLISPPPDVPVAIEPARLRPADLTINRAGQQGLLFGMED